MEPSRAGPASQHNKLDDARINNVLIVKAKDELRGMMRSYKLDNYTVEVGCHWVQGTRTGNGPVKPIYGLALKHKLVTTTDNLEDLQFYDESGHASFSDAVIERYPLSLFTLPTDQRLPVLLRCTVHPIRISLRAHITGAGTSSVTPISMVSIADEDASPSSSGERINNPKVDLTARSGYSITCERPKDEHDWAAGYYHFDWEYAQTPELDLHFVQVKPYFRRPEGRFSDENLLSSIKRILLDEAFTPLSDSQARLSSIVTDISYSKSCLSIKLDCGDELKAKYALVAISAGVLHHSEDVKIESALPGSKRKAIDTMEDGYLYQDFLVVIEKFWDDHESGNPSATQDSPSDLACMYSPRTTSVLRILVAQL
ncbi:hypothetical protein FRC04_002933 [Tulasnella sp. 424]|nr:hypothetical protein FRC04_002933 [Tulasnella sp. 424]